MRVLGRTSRSAGSQLSKLAAATSLVESRYPLTENTFREYGIKEGLLPKHLTLSNVAPFNQANVYLESPLHFSMNDCGKVAKFDTEELNRYLPEGLCGELTKDMTMLPENQPLGIVSRKTTMDLISQLSQYQASVSIAANGFLLDGKRGSGKVGK